VGRCLAHSAAIDTGPDVEHLVKSAVNAQPPLTCPDVYHTAHMRGDRRLASPGGSGKTSKGLSPILRSIKDFMQRRSIVLLPIYLLSESLNVISDRYLAAFQDKRRTVLVITAP
jgi:hypothetical protein